MNHKAISPIVKNKKGELLAVDYLSAQERVGNVVFCCTPVVPVTEFRMCYLPFAAAGFDVYAFDFAGVGNSAGDIRALTIQGICDDFDSVVDHITANSNAPIFLFGDTGTGGLIAQYYASGSGRLQGFAQFGNAIYRDAAPLGMSRGMLRLAYPAVRLLAQIAPGMKLKLSSPKYDGYHAELDNGFYTDALQKYPGFFDMHMSLIRSVLDILCAPDSPIQQGPRSPTLVFKTLHDRYFPAWYFDRYYESLPAVPKRLVTVNDVHNSYYFYPKEFAACVIDWFRSILEKRVEPHSEIELHVE